MKARERRFSHFFGIMGAVDHYFTINGVGLGPSKAGKGKGKKNKGGKGGPTPAQAQSEFIGSSSPL